MKRVTGSMLALVILLGVVFVGAIPAAAESSFSASDACLAVLKEEEGFSANPYWDYTQWTVGYGTRCPDDMREYYAANGITEAEAETLLLNHLSNVYNDLNKFADKYGLTWTQNQFDALVLFSYNCGTAWSFDESGTFNTTIRTAATGNDLIRGFALWCSAGNEIKTFLLRRRLSEANMYLNGVYSRTAPENYCYVLYDANGGFSSPRSQGYDSDLTAEPFPVPTYTGYTFDGWYTAKKDGTKVTVLDASTKSATLYAHWLDASGNTVVEEEKQVTVTVTGIDVNVRKGPGTNYTKLGTRTKGDQLLITETASGSGYRWGKFDGGWICLQYTNYDEAIQQENGEQPPVSTEPPAETEPPATEPPATEPPATEPPATEPPATEPPAATEPESTTVMGTVKVNDSLNVRSGPSTGYERVGQLGPNARVEILEQKAVGSMVWGRISNGWICLDYVQLDSTGSNGGEQNNGQSASGQQWTGTIVNCSQWLRIRSGAGTNFAVAGYLHPGDQVTITEQKMNGSTTWGKITEGWISMDYVRLDSAANSGTSSAPTTPDTPATPSTPSTSTTYTGTIVNCRQWLRIRGGAGTSYPVAGYLHPGDQVTITELTKNGSTQWGKIDSGWISMDYVRLDGTGTGSTTTDSNSQTRTITADCLRIRSGAGTENTIVGYLYYGTKVEILETATAADGSLWGKVTKGWISMDYAK